MRDRELILFRLHRRPSATSSCLHVFVRAGSRIRSITLIREASAAFGQEPPVTHGSTINPDNRRGTRMTWTPGTTCHRCMGCYFYAHKLGPEMTIASIPTRQSACKDKSLANRRISCVIFPILPGQAPAHMAQKCSRRNVPHIGNHRAHKLARQTWSCLFQFQSRDILWRSTWDISDATAQA